MIMIKCINVIKFFSKGNKMLVMVIMFVVILMVVNMVLVNMLL